MRLEILIMFCAMNSFSFSFFYKDSNFIKKNENYMRIQNRAIKTKQLQQNAAKTKTRTYDLRGKSKWFCQNKTIVLTPQLGLIKTPSKKNPMGKTLKGGKEHLVKTWRDLTKLTKSKIWQSHKIIGNKTRNKRRSRMPPSRGLNTRSSRSQTICCLVSLMINRTNMKSHLRNLIQA